MYTVRMLEAWLHCFLTETERFFLKAIGRARARCMDSSPFRADPGHIAKGRA